MDLTVIVVVVVVTALAFDFTNGFHDTANAMATSIATRALKPRTAVLIAGVLNLVGAFLSIEVAKTISSGLVDEAKITPTVIFASLVGAILWNLLTWLVGLPSSSSHALFGGLIGATWRSAPPQVSHSTASPRSIDGRPGADGRSPSASARHAGPCCGYRVAPDRPRTTLSAR
jgi:PiT family inorganic phosphate transporter